jgi:hypothetical protein
MKCVFEQNIQMNGYYAHPSVKIADTEMAMFQ